MQEMFTRTVEAKDASLVDTYYDPDFLLTTNGASGRTASRSCSSPRTGTAGSCGCTR
jgi:hypothetical protein